MFLYKKKKFRRLIIFNTEKNIYEEITINVENITEEQLLVHDCFIKKIEKIQIDVDFDLNNNKNINKDILSLLKRKYTKLDNLMLYLKYLLLYNYETWTLKDSESINRIKNIQNYQTTLLELKEEKNNIEELMNNLQ